MSLSEFERKRVEKLLKEYCEAKIPSHLRDRIRLEYRIRGNEVSLYESRPHWQGNGAWLSTKIARFRRDLEARTWQLYWADRHGKWRSYSPLPFHRDIETLLHAVDRNVTGVFWG